MRVTPYAPTDAAAWDAFVQQSRNGTFLFERAYMDYHADRFRDASLIVRDDRDGMVAVLPANRYQATLHTHQGLTYGGLVLGAATALPAVLEAFRVVLEWAHREGIEHIAYKTVPAIFHRSPSDDDRYALFRARAVLVRRDAWSAVGLAQPGPMQERRARSVRKATKAGVELLDGVSHLPEFWAVLTENLQRRYGVDPVHSLAEITLLASRFPDAIQVTTAHLAGELVAGVVLFVSDRVAHVQYPGTAAAGQSVGALDLIHATLMQRHRGSRGYYDFGASTEQAGRRVNAGLLEYKEGFGARTVTHDFYDIDVVRAMEQWDDV